MDRNRLISSLKNILVILFVSLSLCSPVIASDNHDLLPDHQTPIIDLAKSLSETQRKELEESLNDYESKTGWKIKVLTQYERSPGLAIKDFWQLDETSLVLIADPRGGNLLNFNVGDAYFALLPRLFWVELQTRYGNQFFVKEKGEDGAILESIESVRICLDKGGCNVVPGLPKEQWIWTLSTSILGGIIAGVSAVPRQENVSIAWKWLVLMSPLWIMLFGIFGIAPVITRTSELLPLLRNIVSFLACSIIAFLITPRRPTNQVNE
ncbi:MULTISPECIES: TPM domain-containing protein [unclassified Prochlorococcus]|uniref:TPM domain-containing protein n=1 Tax=unclassified Prochlorococcus TaxID=2627481 RepID=UPI000533AAAF|nr:MULTISPECIES: TPM domain-containing protein [unclassified Prochlorococcus]KGG15335.1 hypothetical protein EV06_1206 [Prochlorococcus sp. MIT 0602]KGG17613.1 hypothetical protein EV07_1053 [Prochlorococcus sp. MIT 0603]